MKKKILSLMLAMVMMLSLSVTALAGTNLTQDEDGNDVYANELTVTVNKTVSGSAIGTAEDFAIEVEGLYVTDAAEGTTVPAISGIKVSVNAEETTGSNTLSLPTYNSVGIYYYKVTETVGDTLGVDYDESVYILKVTVLSQEKEDGSGTELVNVVSVWNAVLDEETGELAYDEDGNLQLGSKVDAQGSDSSAFGFTNTYTANKLTVTKTISGNLADPTQAFTFTVTFSNTTDYEWTNAITTSNNVTQAVDEDGNLIENTYTFSIIGGASATFDNLPSGLTYTVTEDDYSSDGYTTTIGTATTRTTSDDMAGEDVTVTVNNDKDPGADTGISLDSLPYILMLIVVAAGVVVMISRRRLDNRF